ncbi:SMP-30/gluconolactonase/LRE family protein [Flammeovirga sp. EKP202]|uniref:SMP-30/gluconolactonase/LRE family protein n=1 Tax=Flammeovirga sp. EKP202 TaxID=2770592 RepID=UPI00165F1BF7|nr:SMP-30/gluconolactonase/LRE family protein [Flammeovirga sp. EKP202]MBD0402974.1 SMP-30/gluconolactonase/LRE family protein [Flammeovirga sp. EKP202]
MNNAKYIIGVYNVEDMILIPGTKWIVGGGITAYGPGAEDQVITKNYLHLFDSETETGDKVDSYKIAIRPDSDIYPETNAPDWETFSPHGISFGKQENNKITLYACNHGGRESVEAFEIDYSGDTPTFTWIGAIVAQEDFWPDAVAYIPDGGLVVTSTQSPLQDPEEAIQMQLKGGPVGSTRLWYSGKGWSNLEGAEKISTPNGVLVSPDGNRIYVAASTNFGIYRIDRSNEKPVVDFAKVDGIPDNIRWSADGKSMLAGVHTADPMVFATSMGEAIKTGGNIPTPFNITRIDAETMETSIVVPSAIYATMGGGTGAIEVGNRLWVSTTKADRIAIFDLD